jgi:hypothetical protein
MMAIPWAISTLLPPDSVARCVAIGDCLPASLAYEASTSRSAQLRAILVGARALTHDWLPVDVPRALNTDPDRLSHPSLIAAVIADAEALNLTVVRARIPAHLWELLSAVTLLSLTNERHLARGDTAVDRREGANERAVPSYPPHHTRD